MRTDYYNDPNAPAPNSVVPSASAIVTDEHGRILLIHKPYPLRRRRFRHNRRTHHHRHL